MNSKIVLMSNLGKQDRINTQVIEQSFIESIGEMDYETVTLSLLSKRTGIDQKAISDYYPTKKILLDAIEQKIFTDISRIVIEEKFVIVDAMNELKKNEPKKCLSQFLASYRPFFQTAVNPSLFFDFQRKFCVDLQTLIMNHYFSTTSFPKQQKKFFLIIILMLSLVY